MSSVVMPPSHSARKVTADRTSRVLFQSLFAAVVIVMIVRTVIMKEYVLTPDVYARLISARFDAVRVNEIIAMRDRWGYWPYLLAPVILAVRAAWLASIFQLILLVFRRDVPFGRLFRAMVGGELVLVSGGLTHVAWLASLPSESITGKMVVAPWGSLGTFFSSGWARAAGFAVSPVGQISVIDIAWWLTISLMIVSPGIGRRRAIPAGLVLWILVDSVMWLLGEYLSRASL